MMKLTVPSGGTATAVLNRQVLNSRTTELSQNYSPTTDQPLPGPTALLPCVLVGSFRYTGCSCAVKRMVELWVSLVRNAACVLKSVLPAEHRVMQPLMSFPFPAFSLLGLGGGSQQRLEMFTSLEGLIGLLQLAGAGFNLLKGAKVCDRTSQHRV